ncbi:MAG: hypothetical protein K6G50_12645 [bacterium]|nr:hypothetical protein [bacterium]
MKYRIIILTAIMAVFAAFGAYGQVNGTMEDKKEISQYATSPEWAAKLGEEQKAEQIFIIAALGETTAWVSMHEKDESGAWKMIMTTPGFIGQNGLGKIREGDRKTPAGVFHFNRAFGIADDPGCAIPYVKADDNTYWSGDSRPGKHYNELVSLADCPDLDTKNSEHITYYQTEYQYAMNISYNEKGEPGLGSAIFLHCFGDRKPYTGGCTAIPKDKMLFVMQNVHPDCVVVIDSMENLGASF